MPPTNTKANYKTYEAQARMVRAIVAAHPDVKWNYKDIAKYFGQSTADGIQFQFRQIKRDAEQLRKVESEGGNVANCLSFGAGSSIGPSTPSKPISSRGVGSRSGATSKRSRATPAKPFIKDESDDGEEDLNFSELDETPSKRVKTTGGRGRTPSRRAATQANVTIAASAHVESSASPPEDVPTPTTEMATSMTPVYAESPSIFGKVEHQHPAYDAKPTSYSNASPFNSNGVDEYLGLNPGMYTGSKYSEFDGDGEI